MPLQELSPLAQLSDQKGLPALSSALRSTGVPTAALVGL